MKPFHLVSFSVAKSCIRKRASKHISSEFAAAILMLLYILCPWTLDFKSSNEVVLAVTDIGDLSIQSVQS